jgi:hypothetical protein
VPGADFCSVNGGRKYHRRRKGCPARPDPSNTTLALARKGWMPTPHTRSFPLLHSGLRAAHRSLNTHLRMSSIEAAGHTDQSMLHGHIAEGLGTGVRRHTNTKEGENSPLEQGSRRQWSWRQEYAWGAPSRETAPRGTREAAPLIPPSTQNRRPKSWR